MESVERHRSPFPQRIRQPNSTRILPHTHGESLIGSAISVYWDVDCRWYVGTVKAFDRVSGWHVVCYDDGEQRNEPLNDPLFRWSRHDRISSSENHNASLPQPLNPNPDAQPEKEEAEDKESINVVSVVAMSDSDDDDDGAVEVATEEQQEEEDPLADNYERLPSEYYQVERVIAERNSRFLVRWVGCPPAQDTWEPIGSFLDTSPIELFRQAQEAWEKYDRSRLQDPQDGETGAKPKRGSHGLFECESCWRTFPQAHGLLIHRSRCKGPGSAFDGPKPLARADGLFECEDCGRSFQNSHGLQIHSARCKGPGNEAPKPLAGEDGLFECEGCGRTFQSAHGLSIHQGRGCVPQTGTANPKAALPPPPLGSDGLYVCEACGRKFESVQGVRLHQTRFCNGLPAAVSHREAQPQPRDDGLFECTAGCGRAYSYLARMVRHASTCSGVPPAVPDSGFEANLKPNADGLFECEQCQRAFNTAHGVVIHRHTCTGVAGAAPKKKLPPPVPNADGLFECELCSKAFESAHGLDVHRGRFCPFKEERPEGKRKRIGGKRVTTSGPVTFQPSIGPPPAPPPLCRCGIPAVWERKRWWCAAREGNECGYEAHVPPAEFPQTPMCRCNERAVFDRGYWWCAIRTKPSPRPPPSVASGGVADDGVDMDVARASTAAASGGDPPVEDSGAEASGPGASLAGGCGFMARADRLMPAMVQTESAVLPESVVTEVLPSITPSDAEMLLPSSVAVEVSVAETDQVAAAAPPTGTADAEEYAFDPLFVDNVD